VKTCIVICNGPSLNQIPDALLNKYPTFGSNCIYLRYTPNYYACVNPLVIDQYYNDINKMACVKFIRSSLSHLVDNSIKLMSHGQFSFSFHPLEWIHEGYTVTYVLLQLALAFGFQRVGLVGCDHRYIYDGKPNEQLTATGTDPNHFDGSYFSANAQWNAPDLARSEQSYRLARQVYADNMCEIVNLTYGTALDVFEKESWMSWM